MVLAYYTEGADWSAYTAPATPNFMSSQTVTWNPANSGSWEYSPIKYWPRSGDSWGKVTFFGASTVTGMSFYGAEGSNPKIAFTTQAAVANQVDLVADVVLNATGGTNSGKVLFQFDHILSKIGFTAQLDKTYSDVTVNVTSLRVYYKTNTVYSTGTYTFNTANDDDNSNSATNNLTFGNWAYTSAAYFAKANDGQGDQVFSGTQALSASAVSLSGTNNYLMLIPQKRSVSGNIDAGDVYVELAYSVIYPGSPALTVLNLAKINLPVVTGGWLPGKAYTYNFKLTLNPVVFDTGIIVNPWTDGTQPGEINL
jgi:hypothetical protein